MRVWVCKLIEKDYRWIIWMRIDISFLCVLLSMVVTIDIVSVRQTTVMLFSTTYFLETGKWMENLWHKQKINTLKIQFRIKIYAIRISMTRRMCANMNNILKL